MVFAEQVFLAVTRSRRRFWLAVIAVLLAAFVLHAAVIFLAMGTHRHPLVVLGDSLVSGLIAGVLAWVVLLFAIERRNRVLRDLRLVADLNHNVRNALQVLVGAGSETHDEAQTRLIMDAVHRIDETLRALFPAIGGRQSDRWWDAFSDGELPPRRPPQRAGPPPNFLDLSR